MSQSVRGERLEPHSNTDDIAVSVNSLSKTFYSGFFGPIPVIRERSFGRLHRVVKALKEVSFEIKRGEIFALLGANGAGKSTTMKMLMGLMKPTSGAAHIFGRDTRTSRARERVGYLPENPSFYEELTPRELLRLFSALHGLKTRQGERQCDELIDRVGMTYAADRPLRKLSKGMHQRIGVAQALINEPELIVLDEPFSGLDPIGRRDVREVLLAERDRGATLLFTSHILPDVEALCDRFLILESGQVTHQGVLADLLLETSEIELKLSDASEALINEVTQLNGASQVGGLDHSVITLKIPHEKGDQALALIMKHEANIYSLNRVKPHLEQLFTRGHSAGSEDQTAHVDREDAPC